MWPSLECPRLASSARVIIASGASSFRYTCFIGPHGGSSLIMMARLDTHSRSVHQCVVAAENQCIELAVIPAANCSQLLLVPACMYECVFDISHNGCWQGRVF